MDKEIILKTCKNLQKRTTSLNFYAHQAELKNLIQVYAGKNNSYFDAVEKLKITAPFAPEYLNHLVDSFMRSVENDLISNVSFERKIKIEVVNDYLLQAEGLLEIDIFHPSIAAALIGASLEEFLRNWIIDENIDISGQKASIGNFADALRKKNLITKQELKEIGVWGGYRNEAAHGNWKAVQDRDKIMMMLKGVSLFVKQYSK